LMLGDPLEIPHTAMQRDKEEDTSSKKSMAASEQ
jgi:hypothetical protein